MTSLPTIKEIAINLYAAEGTVFHNETLESVPQDNREGFDRVVISAEAIRYTTNKGNLIIQEIVGVDENLVGTTLDYLYSIEDVEWFTEEGGTDNPQELISIIKEFMGNVA